MTAEPKTIGNKTLGQVNGVLCKGFFANASEGRE